MGAIRGSFVLVLLPITMVSMISNNNWPTAQAAAIGNLIKQIDEDCKAEVVQNKTKTVRLTCDTTLNNLTLTKQFLQRFRLLMTNSTKYKNYTIGDSPYPVTEVTAKIRSEAPCQLIVDRHALSAVPNLTHLSIHLLCPSSVLSIFDDEFKHLPKLDYLYLQGLPAILDLINGAKSLKELKLEDTGELDLEPGLFTGSKQFVTLEVNKQTLQLYGGSLKANHYPNLEKLIFWETGLTKLPDGLLAGLKKLKYLNIGSNDVRNVTRAMFRGLTALTNLYLDFNEIPRFDPDVFKEMPNLEYIGLEHNHLKELPEKLFSYTRKLKYIGVASNELRKISNTIFGGLAHLQSLFAHNNSIVEIQAGAFDHLHNLTTVDLSCNPLPTIPAGLFRNCPKLKAVTLPESLQSSVNRATFPRPLDSLDFVPANSPLCTGRANGN